MPGENRLSSVPSQSLTAILGNQRQYTRLTIHFKEWFTFDYRAQFKTLLSTTLKKAGLDESKYNFHGFRIGAATSAKAAGISDMHIQLCGQWRSSRLHQDPC